MISRYKRMNFQDYIGRLFPDIYDRSKNPDDDALSCRTITFKVTDDCNLRCTYCYQTNKQKKRMSFETAKRFADYLLNSTMENNSYINPTVSPGVIIEFIGGEPMLEVDLIEQICDYFEEQMILMNHPWLEFHRYSICTNGVNYFSERVQRFLKKYSQRVSLSITLDGNKAIHDACRVFPDGSPSYDIVVEAVKHNVAYFGNTGSKVTIAPDNIDHLYGAIINLFNLGLKDIHANTVFEDVWDNDIHPKKFYNQLVKIADYLIEKDIVETTYLSLFEENYFCQMAEDDNKNWCGGDGKMLACDTRGDLYPCIRYMDTSLDGNQRPMIIGNIYDGIGCDHDCKNCISNLRSITRRSQSTDECFNCPIAKGCAWCSAYNYQTFGTVNKRATFICHMHKARALANVYFWNKFYKKKELPDRMPCYLSYDKVSHIIDKDEYDKLIKLSE